MRATARPLVSPPSPTAATPAPAPPSRRALLASYAGALIAAAATTAAPPSAVAGPRGYAAYVRKRSFGAVDTYVPPLLAARAQLVGVEALLATDPREARSRLRSGAFVGLRENVRAVGEFAANAGAATAAAAVPSFFSAVERLDYTLFTAIRADRTVKLDEARAALTDAVAALDAVTAGLPADVVATARRVAEAASGGGSGEGVTVAPELEAIVPEAVVAK